MAQPEPLIGTLQCNSQDALQARAKEGNPTGWWDSILRDRQIPVPYPPQHKSRLSQPGDQQRRQIEEEKVELLPA